MSLHFLYLVPFLPNDIATLTHSTQLLSFLSHLFIYVLFRSCDAQCGEYVEESGDYRRFLHRIQNSHVAPRQVLLLIISYCLLCFPGFTCCFSLQLISLITFSTTSILFFFSPSSWCSSCLSSLFVFLLSSSSFFPLWFLLTHLYSSRTLCLHFRLN